MLEQGKRVSNGVGLLLMIWLGVASVSAYADVYRWVDDHGRVHFSDKKPAGNTAQTLDMPEAEEQPGAPDLSEFERMQRQKKLVKMLEEERLEKANKKAKLAQEAEAQVQYCTRFKNRLTYLDRTTHFYSEQDDGTRVYMSDQEAEAYRARVKNQYQVECGEA